MSLITEMALDIEGKEIILRFTKSLKHKNYQHKLNVLFF